MRFLFQPSPDAASRWGYPFWGIGVRATRPDTPSERPPKGRAEPRPAPRKGEHHGLLSGRVRLRNADAESGGKRSAAVRFRGDAATIATSCRRNSGRRRTARNSSSSRCSATSAAVERGATLPSTQTAASWRRDGIAQKKSWRQAREQLEAARSSSRTTASLLPDLRENGRSLSGRPVFSDASRR